MEYMVLNSELGIKNLVVANIVINSCMDKLIA